MKKISLFILIAVCALLVISACGAKADPYKIYKDAETKTNSLKNYSAGVELEIAADFGNDSTYNMNTVSTISADLDAGRSLQKFSYVSPDEGEYSVTLFHESGVTFFTNGETSYKYAEEDSSALMSASSVAAFDFPESAFASAAVEAGDSGSVITVRMKGDDVGSLCRSYLEIIEQVTALTYDFNISDVDAVLTVDADGYLVNVKLNYSASFDFVGSDATAVVAANISYSDVKGTADPKGPEGYLEFPDYDPSSGSSGEGDDGEIISDADAAAIDAAFALYEDDHHTRVENYDELYRKACAEYGKDTIDSIVEIIEMFGAVDTAG